MTKLSTRLRIKDWAEEDRPREKILLKGIHSLSDAELLAILIGSGNKEETVVELAQRILLSAENNLNQLGKLSINYLVSNFKGIGKARAVAIVAALELGKRRKNDELPNREKIVCSKDIYSYFHPLMCDLPYEEFWVLFLNRAHKITGKIKISQGGVSETVVDSKLIFKEAIAHLASSLVLCHNHPSENEKPSRQDDLLTIRIKEGAELLGICLLDHVIVCGAYYYSYADEGRIL